VVVMLRTHPRFGVLNIFLSGSPQSLHQTDF
jgi:hypothetical protein